VVLASMLPVADHPPNRGGLMPNQRVPPERIRAVNDWIRKYAADHGHTFLDYHSAMAGAGGLVADGLSRDGLHPSEKGYAVMAPLAERAIAAALAGPVAPKDALTVRDLPSEGADAVTFPGASALTPRTCEELARLKAEVTWHDRYRADWAELTHYADANAAVTTPPAVVFTGDSITDLWDEPKYGAFFPGKPYLNRGISAQSSPQMFVRFRQDVIDLRPRAVVILAGANDMGGNTGPTNLRALEDNLEAMSELARIHGIRVILASSTPVSDYDRIRQGSPRLRTTRHPPDQILRFNRWLLDYARSSDAVYLDYHAALIDARGLLKDEYTDDGLHPNADGYKVMAPLAEKAIARALGGR
jgi:lysophospholipase L1-like esterase